MNGIFTSSIAEDTLQRREPTPLQKETFAILKKEFPGEILTETLGTLDALADSPAYKNFLVKAFPMIRPIPAFEEIVNFDEVIYSRLPPKERYLTYYTEQFGVQTPDDVSDTEHFLIHYEATETWMREAIERSNDIPIFDRPGGLSLASRTSPSFMKTTLFREMMETRFGINPEGQMSPEIMSKVIRHIRIPILQMTKAQMTTEARWVHTLFEKHGTAEGMLWVALQDPILFERIRYAFTTNTTFMKYVYTDPDAEARSRHKKRLREFKEWQQRQKKP